MKESPGYHAEQTADIAEVLLATVTIQALTPVDPVTRFVLWI